MNILPKFGWTKLSPEEALDFGLEQVTRRQWEIWTIEWFNSGISLWVRYSEIGEEE